METVKHYFDYEVHTLCGIPEFHLIGTVEDWKNVKKRSEKFKEFDLDWWIKVLHPVLDKIIETVETGKMQDKSFWESFYK